MGGVLDAAGSYQFAMIKQELQYAAGFFDAEGCICIGKNKHKQMLCGYQYELHVVFSSTFEPVARWFGFKFLSSICHIKENLETNRQENWRWAAYCGNGLAFLKQVRPYLVIKADEADLAIGFQERISSWAGKLTAEEIAWRECVKSKISEYKRRSFPCGELTKGPRDATSGELCYLAGFFDGEGCVTVVATMAPNGRNLSHELAVGCACTYPDPIVLLYSIFGGHTSKRKRKSPQRDLYRWEIKNRKAADALRRLQPYLLVKRAQADLGIKFQEYKIASRPRPAMYGVSPEVLEKRQEFMDKLHALNKRGL